MRVGLLKTSLVDYPGRVAAVLFLPGCGMRCPYCHNPGLVEPGPGDLSDDLVPLVAAMDFLERRRGVLTGVVLSGGEPTMHEDLPGLVASIRSLGYVVKLDTNGSSPDRIAQAGADYTAMDLKTDPDRYVELWPGAPADAAHSIRRSVRAVRGSSAQYEFRITCVPGFVGERDAESIASLLEPGDPVFLQRYRPGRVLDRTWAAGVSPYDDATMERLLTIIREAAPKARIRGF
ncbi:MAG: anaerobic ribonucleoside-triphosphate reductase activating protein [Spirochaetae bacterium HGW-Spirochaetae-7]|jgi:pyruvate formate lyase activating enzyme|nr:MAG: anaerobic ribonucleoside-triphosphate reductase activating protein [Spirochaetae bacterium HGW-Spirochaetae-7]